MASGEHLLAFRVLRLAKPTLNLDQPLRLDITADLQPDTQGSIQASSNHHASLRHPFTDR